MTYALMTYQFDTSDTLEGLAALAEYGPTVVLSLAMLLLSIAAVVMVINQFRQTTTNNRQTDIFNRSVDQNGQLILEVKNLGSRIETSQTAQNANHSTLTQSIERMGDTLGSNTNTVSTNTVKVDNVVSTLQAVVQRLGALESKFDTRNDSDREQFHAATEALQSAINLVRGLTSLPAEAPALLDEQPAQVTSATVNVSIAPSAEVEPLALVPKDAATDEDEGKESA